MKLSNLVHLSILTCLSVASAAEHCGQTSTHQMCATFKGFNPVASVPSTTFTKSRLRTWTVVITSTPISTVTPTPSTTTTTFFSTSTLTARQVTDTVKITTTATVVGTTTVTATVTKTSLSTTTTTVATPTVTASEPSDFIFPSPTSGAQQKRSTGDAVERRNLRFAGVFEAQHKRDVTKEKRSGAAARPRFHGGPTLYPTLVECYATAIAITCSTVTSTAATATTMTASPPTVTVATTSVVTTTVVPQDASVVITIILTASSTATQRMTLTSLTFSKVTATQTPAASTVYAICQDSRNFVTKDSQGYGLGLSNNGPHANYASDAPVYNTTDQVSCCNLCAATVGCYGINFLPSFVSQGEACQLNINNDGTCPPGNAQKQTANVAFYYQGFPDGNDYQTFLSNGYCGSVYYEGSSGL